MDAKYDFSGWATKNDLKCSDGRIIRHNAFEGNDGMRVPLVWNHCHSNPSNILGHALLENREEGVYAYCSLNDTEAGRNAKEQIMHGDITALSIYANKLKQNGGDVLHGVIREVSLVLAGANPGAYIDSIMAHGEESEEECIIYTGETFELFHGETKEDGEDKMSESKEKTIGEVLETLNEEQKAAVCAVVGMALDEKESDNSEGGNEEMKHNVFDNEEGDVMQHSFDFKEIVADAKRCGSLKEAVLAHADQFDDDTSRLGAEHPAYGTYGLGEHTDYLFPDTRTMQNIPEFVKRDTTWVGELMNKTHHTPFSRIKSVFADITGEDARAKGYVRGNYKEEEVIALLKRETTPQTIYKKQRMDRDDLVDITDLDVVSWIKGEMRLMLDEEIARAVLVGDGRSAASNDKINPMNIRPIYTDDDFYSIKQKVSVSAGASDDAKAKAFIRSAIKARKNYKGSGNPILFTTEDMLTDMLLLEDTTGRIIYDSETKLATALRVSKIVTAEVMENLTRTWTEASSSVTGKLMGIIVNPADYNIGADKGGAINMFDDFDIDYNQQKYLIETRCSGALTKPYSAIVLECVESAG